MAIFVNKPSFEPPLQFYNRSLLIAFNAATHFAHLQKDPVLQTKYFFVAPKNSRIEIIFAYLTTIQNSLDCCQADFHSLILL